MPVISPRVDFLRLLGRDRAATAAAVATIVAAAAGWAFVASGMKRMDMGTGLGPFPDFIQIWPVMMAAMMLPSAVPMVASGASLNRSRGVSVIATAALVGIYLLAWTAFGVAAYFIYDAIVNIGQANSSWNGRGFLLAGIVIAGGGLYGLTPVKRACQARCRALARSGWSPEGGTLRWVVRAGADYSLNCIGTSLGPMVVLLALGLTNIALMVIVTAIVLVQKVMTLSNRIDSAIALALMAYGVWVAVAAVSGAMLMAVQ